MIPELAPVGAQRVRAHSPGLCVGLRGEQFPRRRSDSAHTEIVSESQSGLCRVLILMPTQTNSAQSGAPVSVPFLEWRFHFCAAFATRDLAGEFHVQKAESGNRLFPSVEKHAQPFHPRFHLGDFARPWRRQAVWRHLVRVPPCARAGRHGFQAEQRGLSCPSSSATFFLGCIVNGRRVQLGNV